MTKNRPVKRKTGARILIVDDHPVVREGLRMHINAQADMKVCAEAADEPEALRLVCDLKPDAIVVDLSLKVGNGIDLIKRIKARSPTARVLVWTMHSENIYAERALRAGALGYIDKEHATEQIIEALRTVLNGNVYLSEAMAARLLKRAIGPVFNAEASSIDTLSDRELQVFEAIGRGLDTAGVARKMSLSPKTVETYRARIKEKLKVHSGPELMQRAVEWVVQNG